MERKHVLTLYLRVNLVVMAMKGLTTLSSVHYRIIVIRYSLVTYSGYSFWREVPYPLQGIRSICSQSR